MPLSEHAFRHRPLVLMLVVLLMGFGIYSYFTLPAQEDPKVTIREAVVTTRYPGLSAERVERLVTRTLEEAIRQMPEIEEIRSLSMPGVSIIHAEVHDRYFALDQIWDDLRQRVEAARARLPQGTQRPLVNDDFGDVAVLTAALTAEGFSPGEMFDMAKHLRDTLYRVEGTRRIDLLGVEEERIFIETTNARLAELGLSSQDLADVLASRNIIRPGGEIDTGRKSFLVEPTGNFESLEAIRETLVPLPDDGGLVPLRDLAEVRRATADPPQRLTYVNGEQAIVFAFSMLEGYRVLDYGPRLKAALAAAQAELPLGYQLEIITYQPQQVERAVYGVTGNVLQTLVIVLAVVVLFLGLRTGLVVGAIVPTVMLTTLAVMGLAGLALERMSLATLVIALGLLVDNAIVVAEDFKRRLEEGLARDAALAATGRELALPLLSSTLTTILVFVPLMMAEHVAGEYTRSISLVILISLLASWLLAMTLTPILCHRFTRVATPAGSAPARGDLAARLFRPLERGYERLLQGTLARRGLFLGVMLGLMAAAIFAMQAVPQKFFPDSDRAQVLVYVDLPADVSTRATDAAMREIFTLLKDETRFPRITGFAGYVGFGGPRFVLSLTPIDPAPNRGFILVNLDSFAAVRPTIAALREAFRAEFPGLAARVTGMFLGPSDSSVIKIRVRGPDAGFIRKQARRVQEVLAGVPGMIDIHDDWENPLGKIVVDVDQIRARRAGVSSADVAGALETYFSGRVVSEFREGDDVFPIVARAADAERGDPSRISSLSVFSRARGVTVPLAQVADIRLEADHARIARVDLVRTITVEARNTRLSAEEVATRIAPQIEAINADLPYGYAVAIDGVVKQAREGRAALAANLPLALGIILVLLVAQFNGFLRPLIILATIPLLLIGAALGLHVMQAPFGFMVLLGLYALAGIIINNAIVLIDRIDIERTAGNGTDGEALVRAAVRRLRPIVMTTITTILGLMPLILAQDALFYGMASVMAFGLLVGTMLTLGVVPVIYSLILRISPRHDGRNRA